jgi:hypothetical protein
MFRKEDRKRNIQSITIGTPGFEDLSKYGSVTGWTEILLCNEGGFNQVTLGTRVNLSICQFLTFF